MAQPEGMTHFVHRLRGRSSPQQSRVRPAPIELRAQTMEGHHRRAAPHFRLPKNEIQFRHEEVYFGHAQSLPAMPRTPLMHRSDKWVGAVLLPPSIIGPSGKRENLLRHNNRAPELLRQRLPQPLHKPRLHRPNSHQMNQTQFLTSHRATRTTAPQTAPHHRRPQTGDGPKARQ